MALDKFFELIDEHRTRQARVVAPIQRPPGNPDVPVTFKDGDLCTRTRLRVAEEIKMVVYTDDPGFFLSHDDEVAERPTRSLFCPSLSHVSSRGYPFRPDEEFLTILDPDEYGRLLREDAAFRQQRNLE